MELISNPKVKTIFDNYPQKVKTKMLRLRELVFEAAEEIEGLNKLEETLKWGEPSYLTKHGSTLRMDWKEKNPEQVALYFQCTSMLVPTFKVVYKDTFEFEGNRAVLMDLNQNLPEKEIKHCMSIALTYHKVKHIPLLGA